MLTETQINIEGKAVFSTKAETLFNLLSKVTSAKILPLYFFTVGAWKKNKSLVLSELKKADWFSSKIVVRSSAIGEDSKVNSLAGKYTSVINVQGEKNFLAAVERVITSFECDNPNHQILVQPHLSDTLLSGVAFGRDPNTDSPYIIINYNDSSNDTTSVTSGHSNHKCYIHHHNTPKFAGQNTKIEQVIRLVYELEQLFDTDYLDIEFAIDKQNELYLLQIRPLVRQVESQCPSTDVHQKTVERIAHCISLGMKPHPYLHGKQTVYGVMPDWNPAEIIGIRPKPLALSLYRELVTNAVWAYQRDNYGYANLRSFPLLVDFEGLPYIDVRVSFNSFLPKQLPIELSERLVNYYLESLIASPMLHDKIEFDIVFSCYTLDLRKRLTILNNHGFTDDDTDTLFSALVQLTNQIIDNKKGLWKKDLAKIEELRKRQQRLFNSDLDSISKMYWILEDCKRYGTLPFAGLARAGFIAIQILRSFVNVGIINEQEYTNFLTSVNSVSSNMKDDFNGLSKEDFLAKYGHLRPGTYDILSFRYDEAPELYFDWCNKDPTNESDAPYTPFSLTMQQLRKIQEYIEKDQLQISVLELLEFIKIAIESREYSKFVFSRSISEFLRIIGKFTSQYGISREDCAYIDLKEIMMLYSSSIDPEEAICKSIMIGKKHHQLTAALTLPTLITHPSQVWSFEQPETFPNFITQKKATGSVSFVDTKKNKISDTILMIPSADPGYDWVFSHKIAGFITKYGGVNSHMAIRAGEQGIPAIIGAGEIQYNLWSKARKLHIDCLNKQVQLL